MSKILIAYFSANGHTARLADTLAKAIDGELHEIKPMQPYSKADLNWNDMQSRANLEMQDALARPEIENPLASIEEYDVVFVGFPIWWYNAPRIIQTFLESYDFSNKTVVPFATSGGSDMGNTIDILKPSCARTTVWKPGKCLRSFSDQAMLSNWVESLDISS
ncbi:MAG: flavodoxin [Erysipelotrichaceae bacterium]|nr:flavodoxin [Erysipelotrichaceae bacterium]MDD3809338.1 flavodoxin [Erysipelotrichaceae bacterium]